ncbi:dihydrolipoamide succinyltransferase, partial [Francisella tularensis subsp. holarctica]|nr:dihydrolipoamide succinyltransferase [Francisella tularensis subsp. holarctica]
IENEKVVLEVPATSSAVIKGIKKHAGDTVLSEESLANIDTAVSTSEPNQQTTNKGNASEATATGPEIYINAPVFPESVS